MGIKKLVRIIPPGEDNVVLASSLLNTFPLHIVARQVDRSVVSWSACFEDIEVKEGHFLRTQRGYGEDVRSAVEALFSIVAGRTLVYRAGVASDKRAFTLPNNIKVDW